MLGLMQDRPLLISQLIEHAAQNHGDTEIVTPEELVKIFSLSDVNSSNSKYDEVKFAWVNAQWMQKLPADDLARRLLPFLDLIGIETEADERLALLVSALQPRSETLIAMAEQARFAFVAPAEYDEKGRRNLVPAGEPDVTIPCDDVLVAIGQENSFPWIEKDAGLEFDKWGMPVVDPVTFQSTNPKVFFGGDSAFGPKNIIWAVAHGHEAAVSIDKLCNSENVADRPPPMVTLASQKMGIHEWSYDNEISNDLRYKVPLKEKEVALKNIKIEVELGFDPKLGFAEAQRCLNCDVQTVFSAKLCIECDACVDICPVDCITFTADAPEAELRQNLSAPALNPTQAIYVQDGLKTGRIMAKDEDVCLHCGLCAERCPTGAWDMQKFLLETTKAGAACRSH